MFRFFQPQLYLDSVVELTPEKLSSLGLKSLLLDVDCTLKHYKRKELSPETACWVNEMKEHNIGLCLVSNGRGQRIRQFSESVQIPFVAPAMKPLPFGLNIAIKKMNFDKKTTAMVGDQVFADILAGKFAGLFTILVTPLNPEDEPWFARMKRPLEKIVLQPVEAPSAVLKHR
jgi:HAD superfamily phosphatase (TIGR01668 family)